MWFHNFTLFSHFIHIVFIFFSHLLPRDPDRGPKNHIFVIFLVIFISYCFLLFFLGAGPISGPQESYFCYIPGHIYFILLSSYFCTSLGPLSIPQSLKGFRKHCGIRNGHKSASWRPQVVQEGLGDQEICAAEKFDYMPDIISDSDCRLLLVSIIKK